MIQNLSKMFKYPFKDQNVFHKLNISLIHKNNH